MQTLWNDIRFGLYRLTIKPGFTLMVVLTLALGIGANTAIFSVINAMMFKSLPYTDPERLVAIVQSNEKPGPNGDMQFWSYPKLVALREHGQSFDYIAGYKQQSLTMSGLEQAELVTAEFVTGNYFSMLGTRPAMGRAFLPEEDRTSNSHAVVILGHNLWQRKFNGDPNVIDKTIYLKNIPFTVIGVMPANFRGQSGTVEMWAPMMMAGKLLSQSMIDSQLNLWIKVIGRLKSDVSFAQAQSEMPILASKVASALPPPMNFRPSGEGKELFKIIPLKDTKTDPSIIKSFLILLAAVGFVLLIACANTANLMLASGMARRKEFAIRLALGARRSQIMRQVMTDSVLLALLGGVVGLLVAFWGVKWLTATKPWNVGQQWSQYARTFDYFAIDLDKRVLVFNFTLSIMSGIAFGLIPAWQASGVASQSRLSEMLNEGVGDSSAGARLPRRLSARNLLVVIEIALSFVLLAGAGLMVKSLLKLSAVKLGFDPNNVMTMTLGGERQGPEFYRTVLERLQSLPGVEAASFSAVVPLKGSPSRGPVEIEGQAPIGPKIPLVAVHPITPSYIKTFRISVLKGRGFTEQDRVGSKRVALINRTAAERLWPNENPLGRRVKLPFRASYPNAEEFIEIVGVVDDIKYLSVEEPDTLDIYLSAWQPTLYNNVLAIRSTADLTSILASVRHELHSVSSSVPIYDIKTMRDFVSDATSRQRYSALLLGIFATLALALSAMGVYGVVTCSTSARTREIGIRMAVGAQAKDIFQLIMRDAAVLILAGSILGGLAAVLATRLLSSQLYQLSASDPLTFMSASLLLIGVALVACVIPVRKAMKIDPAVTLRCE